VDAPELTDVYTGPPIPPPAAVSPAGNRYRQAGGSSAGCACFLVEDARCEPFHRQIVRGSAKLVVAARCTSPARAGYFLNLNSPAASAAGFSFGGVRSPAKGDIRLVVGAARDGPFISRSACVSARCGAPTSCRPCRRRTGGIGGIRTWVAEETLKRG
jgi:hypothetical protein